MGEREHPGRARAVHLAQRGESQRGQSLEETALERVNALADPLHADVRDHLQASLHSEHRSDIQHARLVARGAVREDELVLCNEVRTAHVGRAE